MPGNAPFNTPQYHYARLVPERSLSQYGIVPLQTARALARGISEKSVTDYELKPIKDPLALGGGVILATLATLGSVGKTLGIGHMVGLAAWVGSLLLGPRLINWLVDLKTGVNLNQEYINTYDERYNLYRDPQYLPLHLLPDDEINRIGDRLELPYTVDRRRQVEEKIKQIAIQTQTWWLLVAGIAVPVAASGINEATRDFFYGILGKLKSFYHVQFGLKRGGSTSRLMRHLEAYIDECFGPENHSRLKRWQDGFEHRIVEQLGLGKQFKTLDVIKMPDDKLAAELIRHFSELSRVPEKRQAMDDVLQSLARERRKLDSMEHKVLNTIAQYQGALESMDKTGLEKLMGQLSRRKTHAVSTLLHYETLFKAIKRGDVSRKAIRWMMEKPVAGEVQRLIGRGMMEEAKVLCGDSNLFNEIRRLLYDRSQERVAELLGQSPREHLLQSMRNVFSSRRWRNKIIGTLGGGVALATLCFTTLLTGQTFETRRSYEP